MGTPIHIPEHEDETLKIGPPADAGFSDPVGRLGTSVPSTGVEASDGDGPDVDADVAGFEVAATFDVAVFAAGAVVVAVVVGAAAGAEGGATVGVVCVS